MPGYSTNLGLEQLPEFDQRKYPSIFNDSIRIRTAINTLQAALDKYTGALPLDSKLQGQVGARESVRLGDITRFYVTTSAALSYGQMVELYNVAGSLRARKASAASPSTKAKAFVSSTGTIASGELAEVKLLGVLSGLSALTPGASYYLSDTAGYISSTPGTNLQYLGFALSATELFFNPTLG